MDRKFRFNGRRHEPGAGANEGDRLCARVSYTGLVLSVWRTVKVTDYSRPPRANVVGPGFTAPPARSHYGRRTYERRTPQKSLLFPEVLVIPDVVGRPHKRESGVMPAVVARWKRFTCHCCDFMFIVVDLLMEHLVYSGNGNCMARLIDCPLRHF